MSLRSVVAATLSSGALLVVVACGEPTVVAPAAPTAGVETGTSEPMVDSSNRGSTPDSRRLRIDVEEDGLPVAIGRFAAGKQVLVAGRVVEFRHHPGDGLGGSFVPSVVATSDGTFVYYTTWAGTLANLDKLAPGDVGGTLQIRRIDAVSGVDEEWRSGAYGIALAPDGRVAYSQDLDGVYRHSVPNPSQVVVAGPEGDEVWSTETDARYVTMGWAGDTLIAYRVGEGEYLQTFAFDGPGSSRLLSDGGSVGAISPDGSLVLLIEHRGSGSEFITKRVSDGATLDVLASDTEELGPFFGIYGGDWKDDSIVLVASGDFGAGAVLLSWRNQSLVVERLLLPRLDGFDSVNAGVEFTETGGVLLQFVRFTSGKYVYVNIVCDPERNRCRGSAPIEPTTAFVFTNPSRGEGR
jgi:hypothetical protein